MEKTMMILGASVLQIPAIKKAKEMGYRLILVDYDENAKGFAYADVKLVISTMDREEVLRQAKRYQPDVILTSTSDGPVRTAAYVNEMLGKKPDLSYEDSLCATMKDHMRKRLRENGVPIPDYEAVMDFAGFRNAVRRMNGYCIVKPAENAGSRGVELLDIREQKKEASEADWERPDFWERTGLRTLYEYSKGYSRNGAVMVEEFMTGPEVSVEALTVDGETQIIAITDKYITPPPFFVELSHSEPSMLSEAVQARIRETALQAVRAIRLCNGPSHTEIKVTEDGPKVVELAARLGGDFITSRLVPLSTGVDLVGASVQLAAGEKTKTVPRWNRGAAIHFVQAKEGIVKKITVDEKIHRMKGVEEVVIDKKAGDRVHNTQSSNDRIGYVITSADTPQEAVETGKRALALITVELEAAKR